MDRPCAICLENLSSDPENSDPEPSNKVKKKDASSKLCCPPCGHVIHFKCIATWFENIAKKNNRPRACGGSCPTCRVTVNIWQLYPVYIAAETEESLPGSSKAQAKSDPNSALNDLFKDWLKMKPDERIQATDTLLERILDLDEKDKKATGNWKEPDQQQKIKLRAIRRRRKPQQEAEKHIKRKGPKELTYDLDGDVDMQPKRKICKSIKTTSSGTWSENEDSLENAGSGSSVPATRESIIIDACNCVSSTLIRFTLRSRLVPEESSDSDDEL